LTLHPEVLAAHTRAVELLLLRTAGCQELSLVTFYDSDGRFIITIVPQIFFYGFLQLIQMYVGFSNW
jgi:hypothetical protein